MRVVGQSGRGAPKVDPVTHFPYFIRRFLRARRFDVGKSLEMYTGAKQWRERESLDKLFANFDYDRARKAFNQFFPSYLHKFDRSGSPVHVHELSKIDLDGVCILPCAFVRFLSNAEHASRSKGHSYFAASG